MAKTVEFPEIPPTWLLERDCVAFPALVDRKPIRCMITAEALMQDYGARRPTEAESLRAFGDNKAAIQKVALQEIERGQYVIPEDEVLIRASRPRGIHLVLSPTITKRQDLRNFVHDVTVKHVGRFSPKGGDVNVLWDFAGPPDNNLFQVTLEDMDTGGKTLDWFSYDQLQDNQYLRRRFDFLWAEYLSARSAKQIEKI